MSMKTLTTRWPFPRVALSVLGRWHPEAGWCLPGQVLGCQLLQDQQVFSGSIRWHTCNWFIDASRKKNKGTARNPSVSIGFYQLSHLAGTADLRHTLTAGCLSCGMMGRTLGWQKDASLSSLHIWVVHLPVFYFYVTSIYVFGDALVDSSTSLSVHGSARYFVSVRVSVVASCSFLCSQLSSYIVFLPAFQSIYLPYSLPVYLSTYLPTYLPIYHRPIYDIYIHSSFNRSLADLFICFYFVVCFSVCWFINRSFVSWFISQHLIYWI